MMQYYYLVLLLCSILGLIYADWIYKLAWFRNPHQAGACFAFALVFFLVWDIVGILLGVFSTNQALVSGLYIGSPDLPIEEFLFLGLLTYNVVIVWRLVCLRMS